MSIVWEDLPGLCLIRICTFLRSRKGFIALRSTCKNYRNELYIPQQILNREIISASALMWLIRVFGTQKNQLKFNRLWITLDAAQLMIRLYGDDLEHLQRTYLIFPASGYGMTLEYCSFMVDKVAVLPEQDRKEYTEKYIKMAAEKEGIQFLKIVAEKLVIPFHDFADSFWYKNIEKALETAVENYDIEKIDYIFNLNVIIVTYMDFYNQIRIIKLYVKKRIENIPIDEDQEKKTQQCIAMMRHLITKYNKHHNAKLELYFAFTENKEKTVKGAQEIQSEILMKCGFPKEQAMDLDRYWYSK